MAVFPIESFTKQWVELELQGFSRTVLVIISRAWAVGIKIRVLPVFMRTYPTQWKRLNNNRLICTAYRGVSSLSKKEGHKIFFLYITYIQAIPDRHRRVSIARVALF